VTYVFGALAVWKNWATGRIVGGGRGERRATFTRVPVVATRQLLHRLEHDLFRERLSHAAVVTDACAH
jgi:hypothetical protein